MRARLSVRRMLAVLTLSGAAAAGVGMVAAGQGDKPEADSVWDYTVVGVDLGGTDATVVLAVQDSIWD